MEYHKIKPKFAFQSDVWQAALFQLYRLTHCWRYDITGRLGKLLQPLRKVTFLTREQQEEMLHLLLNAEVIDNQETMALMSHRDDAKAFEDLRLEKIKEKSFDFFSVDRRGADRHVNQDGDEHDAFDELGDNQSINRFNVLSRPD